MFTCAYCGRRARTTADRNCNGVSSPDGRHAPAVQTQLTNPKAIAECKGELDRALANLVADYLADGLNPVHIAAALAAADPTRTPR